MLPYASFVMRRTDREVALSFSRMISFVLLGSLITAFLFFSHSVSAQTVAADTQVEAVLDDALDVDLQEASPVSAESGASEDIAPEILLDELVTNEDLGATESRVLPNSPLHFFKRAAWGLQEAVTFDPVKDTELKLEHANQHLAEVQQMIVKNGIDPKLLQKECQRFQNRFAKVAIQAGKLKGLNSETVNQVLSEVTHKQIQQQKVLDVIAKQAIAIKQDDALGGESGQDLEDVDALLGTVQTVKQETVANFANAANNMVEDPEELSDVLTQAFESTKGSELKSLRHLELLKGMQNAVPENAWAAIALARRKTTEQFEAQIKILPPATRANTFKRYIEDTAMQETRLMTLLEEIKQTANIPPEVLERIEEAKEITAKRFEQKLELVGDDMKRQYVGELQSDRVDDLIAMEEMKSRMNDEGGGKQFVSEFHAQALQEFKKKFTDAESQNQADLFSKLSIEMARNPSPKTFKLIREMGEDVSSNPEKFAFLNTMEQEMKKGVEERYEREGDIFTERFASLDPNDISVMEVISFDPAFKERANAKNAEKIQSHIRDIAEPEQFDRFYDRFYHAPPVVINQIRNAAPDFQSAMQFKVRKMEERRLEKEREIARASLDFQERELRHQTDRTQRKQEDEFWQKINDVPFEKFDERKSLWENKINDTLAVTQARYEEQKRIFETRTKLDPWCDAVCAQIQVQFLAQELRHEKERLGDDLRREQNRIEADKFKSQSQKNNPLAIQCDTAENCESFCRANAQLPECRWVTVEETISCAPGSYWDSIVRSCVSDVAVASACGPGTYYDAFSKGCQKDPYYVPPKQFVQCGPGSFWNAARGFCEQENRCQATYTLAGISYTGDCYDGGDHLCPKGFYWDGGRSECVQNGFTECPASFYFDFGLKRCEPDRAPQCGPGQYWDGVVCVASHQTTCPAYTGYTPCPPGSYREPFQDANGCWVSGECTAVKNVCPKEPFPCPAGMVRNVGLRSDGCAEYGSCQPLVCPAVMPRICDPGEKPTPSAPGDYCRVSSCVLPIEKVCPVYDAKPCSDNQTRQWTTDANGCGVPGLCVAQGVEAIYYTFSDGYKAKSLDDAIAHCKANGPGSGAGISATCEAKFGVVYAEKVFCGNGKCESGETTASCTADCGSAPVGYCGDKICNGAETAISCGSDCGTTVSSCPATKYNNNTAGSNSCNYSICSSGCTYNTQGCPSDCYDPNYQCPKTVATGSSLSSWSCSSTCTNGCNYDTKGCATSCLSEADKCKNMFGYHYDSTTKTCVKDNVTCSNPKACDACPSGTSPGSSWCTYDYNGCPSGCQKSTVCGDKICDSGESSWCSSDCGGTTTCDKDTICEPNNGETTGTCPSDCGSTAKVCGDKLCNGTETAISCPTDCGEYAKCNYNGTCDSNETVETCASDCKSGSSCAATEYSAANNSSSCNTTKCANGCNYTNGCPTSCYNPNYQCPKNDVTALNDTKSCDVNKCTNGCTFDGNGCPTSCKPPVEGCATTPASCTTEANCVANKYYWCNGSCYATNATCGTTAKCGNAICDSGETGASCPADCASKCSTTPSSCSSQTECNYSGYYWCDGVCSATASSCTGTTNGYCGDKICNNSETSASCSSDCTGTTSSCASNSYTKIENSAAYCNYTTCPSGCNWTNGCPSGCYTGTTAYCGDKSCNNGETVTTCPADCGTSCTTNSYTKIENGYASCNYSTCPSGCSYTNGCPTGCYTSTSGYCGDKICQSNESPTNCSMDCYGTSNCNSNGICDGSETTASCASDCKSASSCSSNEYNNYTSGFTCNYTKCPSGCSYDSQGCPTGCYTSTSGYCGDKICQSNESPTNCSMDCYGTSNCNSNGICDGSETTASCASDCKSSASVCGNAACESGETTSSCPADCGSPACPSNSYTTGSNSCNYATCPSGCNWSGSCPTGCYTPPATSAYCGDKICNNSETSASCPADCGASTAPTSSCGNNSCESGETMSSCPADCKAPSGLSSGGGAPLNPIKRALFAWQSLFETFLGSAKAGWDFWR